MLYASKTVRLALGSFLEILKQKPFVSLSVRDIVWGHDHPLIKLGNDMLPDGEKLPFNEFGFFVGVSNVYNAVEYGPYDTVESPIQQCLRAVPSV